MRHYALFLGVHNFEQAEKEIRKNYSMQPLIADQEADDDHNTDKDDDAYDSGSGFLSPLTDRNPEMES